MSWKRKKLTKGRNTYYSLSKKLRQEKKTNDDFENLANDEDRDIYHDYLKTNILLWRDKFENSLKSKLPEPTTPEYEQETGEQEVGEEEDVLEIIDL